MDLCQDPKYPEQSMMIEKQPSKRVLKKMCSENMQQIYRGTPLLKYVMSIKLQSNFIKITLQHGYSPVNLLHIFRTHFLKNTSGGLLLYHHTLFRVFSILSTIYDGSFCDKTKCLTCTGLFEFFTSLIVFLFYQCHLVHYSHCFHQGSSSNTDLFFEIYHWKILWCHPLSLRARILRFTVI